MSQVLKHPLKQPRNKQKILVIYTGGTFGMLETLEIPKLSASALKKRLLDQAPEMKKIADCDVEVPFNLDSCQMGAFHWFALAALVHEKQKKYDGVVILHGTDTLSYTASALSYLLSPSPIPIVITGAQKPLSTLRNDARLNFISSLEVAANAPHALRNRVMVVFHDEVFLGSRVRKKSAFDFAAFESPRFPVLAKIGSKIIYQESIHSLPKLSRKNPLLTEFMKKATDRPIPKILNTHVTPEFAASIFNFQLLNELDAILLTLYASGTAPTDRADFIEVLKTASEVYTPVFAITEREDAPNTLSSYEAGRKLLKTGVFWCQDLTPEAAFVKAWILQELNVEKDKKHYYAWLVKNWSKAISDETI